MKIIHFKCACGRTMVAAIHGPGAFRGARIAFYLEEDRRTPITSCIICNRDFSKVTVDEFLGSVWN